MRDPVHLIKTTDIPSTVPFLTDLMPLRHLDSPAHLGGPVAKNLEARLPSGLW